MSASSRTSNMKPPAESPTRLTQFTPLSSEVRQPMGSFSFSRLFRRNKESRDSNPKPPETTLPLDDAEIARKEAEAVEQGQGSSAFPNEYWNSSAEPAKGSRSPRSGSMSMPDSPVHRDHERDIVYKRSITNVLKRISIIRDKRGTMPQPYKDSDFKQYWMPDSNCKECYECGDKFTTFRRRHHCRVCGQIFCSRCCNQEIPGKIMGYTGDLRVCTHCCRIVLSYLQSSDVGGDPRLLQEEVRHKLSLLHPYVDNSSYDFGSRTSLRRKNSVGFREEEFARIRSTSSSDISNFPSSSDFSSLDQMSTERKILAQDSTQLRELWVQIQDPVNGVEFQSHRHRLRSYANCVIGTELVDWLVEKDKASTRPQATAIGQALVDAKLLESVTNPEQLFVDAYALYRPIAMAQMESPALLDTSGDKHSSQERQDPPWVKDIARDEDETTEIESDVTHSDDWSLSLLDAETSSRKESTDDSSNMKSSSSMFYLDLNVHESRVSIFKPKSSGGYGPADPPVTLQVADVHEALLSSLDRGVQLVHEDTSHTTISDEFLKGALLANSIQQNLDDFIPPVGWHSSEQLRTENGEKLAFDLLASAYRNHEQTLLRQLLSLEGLSPSWCDTIVPLVDHISEVVRPDVKNDNDEMDIRQYVQFKKIPGGLKVDCSIVSGVVCSKNVAHKKMRNKITNPYILILSSPIVYQRQENKMLSLDPLVMQEYSYLRNVVSKIASFKPDVLLVEKTVSRLAQDFLLDHGITLVLNVKPSVIERVARSTQANIIKSIDAQITRPHLGMCHSFRVVEHTLPNGLTKNLMYFDGCATHLGCTITLRGGTNAELRKVKKIMQFMVYVAYNWRLERSFLMDEFAMPPLPPEEMSLAMEDAKESDRSDGRSYVRKSLTSMFIEDTLNTQENSAVTLVDAEVESGKIQSEELENEKNSPDNVPNCVVSNGDDDGIPEITYSSPGQFQSPTSDNDRLACDPDPEVLDGNNQMVKLESQFVEDFSDPLHQFLNSDDEPVLRHHGSQLHVAPLPFTNTFRKALDDIVLSCSPFTKYYIPYLETDAGRNCHLRQYFPEEVYWSAHFLKDRSAALNKKAYLDASYEESAPTYATLHSGLLSSCIVLVAWHPFTSCGFTRPLDSDIGTRALLADFRARGGRIHSLCPHEVKEREKEKKNVQNKESAENETVLHNAALGWERKIDALDPFYHQRLVVLFCSYSPDSNNAPNFCVNPRIVNMDFYGCHDITLGGFLERYCFRQEYACPSETCGRPMTNHIRKFAHDSGCVHIVLRQMEEPIPVCQNTIVMWSWCRQCGQVTPRVPMSLDAWCLSFGKYLELRFHGSMYTRRVAKELCNHSLHHDYYQYFGYKQRVVAFKYTPIILREIALPPLVILNNEPPVPAVPIIEEIKHLAITGYSLFSAIHEWLVQMKAEYTNTKYELILADMILQQKTEQCVLREKIEEIQLKLTSPTLESKQRSCDRNHDSQAAIKDASIIMWKISDCVVNVKRLIAEAVTTWNTRVQEFVLQRKKDEKASRPSTGVARLMSVAGSTSGVEAASPKSLEDAASLIAPINVANMPGLRHQLPTLADEVGESLSRASSVASISTNGALTVPSGPGSVHSDENEVFQSETSDFADEPDPLPCSDLAGDDKEVEHSSEIDNVPALSQSSVAPIPTLPHSGSDPLLLEPSPKFELNTGCPQDSPRGSGKKRTLSEYVAIQHFVSRYFQSASYDPTSILSRRGCASPSEVRKTKVEGRGHERSRSEGDGRILADIRLKLSSSSKPDEDTTAEATRTTEKKGVQKIFSQFLSASSATPIQSPFPATEHHLLPRCEKVPIIVYEEEIGSIVSYALSSADYEHELQELRASLTASQRDSLNASPLIRRKNQKTNERDTSNYSAGDSLNSNDGSGYARKTGVLAFFRGGERSGMPRSTKPQVGTSFESVLYSADNSDQDLLEWDESISGRSGVDDKEFSVYGSQEGEKSRSKSCPDIHIIVQFSDPTTKFYCRVYFAEQFRKLRKLIFPHGEESFIRSLSRCISWQAKGGKSGLTFCKTHDDRFILKQMSRFEFQSFLEFAPHYFKYVSRAFAEEKPTVLAKIVGVYRIGYRNSQTNAASKMDLLVIENLFYGRNITQKFDLKGSVRNRMVNTTGKQEGELVLLDENLVKMTCDSPLYIRPHSKTVLTLAINNDTQFLARQYVMDYSLLVGIEEGKQELVVGIIDYIRTFTWDKKIEMMVKSSGIMGGQGKMPTVVSPEMYRKRFCEAMDRYFLHVPDRWSGLGCGVDC